MVSRGDPRGFHSGVHFAGWHDDAELEGAHRLRCDDSGREVRRGRKARGVQNVGRVSDTHTNTVDSENSSCSTLDLVCWSERRKNNTHTHTTCKGISLDPKIGDNFLFVEKVLFSHNHCGNVLCVDLCGNEGLEWGSGVGTLAGSPPHPPGQGRSSGQVLRSRIAGFLISDLFLDLKAKVLK